MGEHQINLFRMYCHTDINSTGRLFWKSDSLILPKTFIVYRKNRWKHHEDKKIAQDRPQMPHNHANNFYLIMTYSYYPTRT